MTYLLLVPVISGWRERGSTLGWPETKDSNSEGDFEEIKCVVAR